MSHRDQTLKQSDFPGNTGRGIRIAVIDTGVHPAHPHIGGIEASVAFGLDGVRHDDVVDRVGHGTAVAAVIHEKAPAAALLTVKIFDRGLVTTGAALLAAIRWATDAGAHLINLSLGTTNASHRSDLEQAVAHARSRGACIVTAAPTPNYACLPGALPDVIAVELDWTCPRQECVVLREDNGRSRVRASGYPRPIPGVPLDQNLKGQSFAVANATGLLALEREGHSRHGEDP